MARRATYINQQRSESSSLLLLDAGDSIWSDRELTVASQSALSIAMMNELGYDAVALGAKDLTLGLDILQKRLDEATFPILSANVVVSGSHDLLASPYTVRDIGGQAIGILALTDPLADPASAPGLAVLDPIEALYAYGSDLAGQSDFFILLSHAGPAINAQIEVQFPTIDLIVAGNQANAADRPRLSDNKPPLLVAEHPTLNHAGRNVGRADLLIDSQGQLQEIAWQSVALGPEWPDDPRLVELLAGFNIRPTVPAAAPLGGTP